MPTHSINLFTGYNINFHSTEISKLNGIPNCCDQFDYGIGSGFSISSGIEYPFNDKISISMNLGYSVLDAELKKNEETKVIVDGKLKDGEFEHVIITEISKFELFPRLQFKLFREFNLFAGLNIGYLTEYSFSQYEKIVKPAGKATFVDKFGNNTNSVFRNQFSGDIPDINKLLFCINYGVSLNMPLNKNKSFMLSPTLYINHSFSNLVANTNWKPYSLILGFAIVYNSLPEPKIIDTHEKIYKIDTLRLESYYVLNNTFYQGTYAIKYDTSYSEYSRICKELYSRTDTLVSAIDYTIALDINTVGLDANNQEIKLPQLQVEEFLSTKMHPLLNYIFFDYNSSNLPEKYSLLSSKEISNFKLDSLFNYNTLEVYYEILNIIGYRLIKNPNSKITLYGYNNGIELEKGNSILSKQRAENIKEYLTEVWGINADRIQIKSGNLPLKASGNSLEGQEENRRVEIYSDNINIISPVIINDTLRITKLLDEEGNVVSDANFQGIRFLLAMTPYLNLAEWKISAVGSHNSIKEFSEKGNLPDFLDWNFENEKERNNVLKDSVFSKVSIIDKKNIKKELTKPLNLSRKTIQSKIENKEGDKKFDKYALILFEFGSMKLSEWNKDIPDYIRKSFAPNSQIIVKGYSDRVGNEDYNKKLSEKRAKTVADALNHPNTTYIGVGEEILLYNNDIPEGRFYCRTIDITVETPIKWK